MSKQKKQSFLGGAAILAAAVVVVKMIGAAYKLPLNNILGDVGMSYWDTAYKIYNFLLTFSTAGLPLAISKLTSEAHAQGRENEKRKIFRTAIWLFFALGLVGSLLMFFQADLLAAFLRNADGRPADPGPGSGGVLRVSAGLHAGLHPGPGQHDAHSRLPGAGGPVQGGDRPAAGLVSPAYGGPDWMWVLPAPSWASPSARWYPCCF